MSSHDTNAATGRVLVRFDAEMYLLDVEIPETLNYASLQQAIQDEIGHTGAKVIEVTEWEQKP